MCVEALLPMLLMLLMLLMLQERCRFNAGMAANPNRVTTRFTLGMIRAFHLPDDDTDARGCPGL